MHIGVLFDVSGSMKSAFTKLSRDQGQIEINSSASSFFIDLLKNQANKNLNPDNMAFALAFGSKLGKVVNFVDAIEAIQK